MRNDSINLSSILSKVLGLGVILSATIIVLGLVLAAITGNYEFPQGSISTIRILGEAVSLNPSAITYLGFLILLITPAFRVMASVLTFYRMKDRTYAVITTTVLVALFIGFLIGVS